MNDSPDIIPRQLLEDFGELSREDIPDIGKNDWLRLVEGCKELRPKETTVKRDVVRVLIVAIPIFVACLYAAIAERLLWTRR